MLSTITIQRLSTGTVYKLWLIALASFFIPFSTLMGVLSLFGFGSVNWNGQALRGVQGLIASPFIGVFLTLLFTAVFGSSSALGLWLYSKFRRLELTVVTDA